MKEYHYTIPGVWAERTFVGEGGAWRAFTDMAQWYSRGCVCMDDLRGWGQRCLISARSFTSNMATSNYFVTVAVWDFLWRVIRRAGESAQVLDERRRVVRLEEARHSDKTVSHSQAGVRLPIQIAAEAGGNADLAIFIWITRGMSVFSASPTFGCGMRRG